MRECGLDVRNSRTGVSVLPDDENCVEFVAAGVGEVTPSDPEYVLKALQKVWPLDLIFDDVSKRALETVSFAASAASPFLKFLTMYMAVEQRKLSTRVRQIQA
jgi:hypothetical protein